MVLVVHGDKKIQLEGKLTGYQILKKLGLKEEEVLLVKDGRLFPLDEEITEGEIRVIPVISGG